MKRSCLRLKRSVRVLDLTTVTIVPLYGETGLKWPCLQLKRSMRQAVEEEDYKKAGELRNEVAAIRAKVGVA